MLHLALLQSAAQVLSASSAASHAPGISYTHQQLQHLLQLAGQQQLATGLRSTAARMFATLAAMAKRSGVGLVGTDDDSIIAAAVELLELLGQCSDSSDKALVSAALHQLAVAYPAAVLDAVLLPAAPQLLPRLSDTVRQHLGPADSVASPEPQALRLALPHAQLLSQLLLHQAYQLGLVSHSNKGAAVSALVAFAVRAAADEGGASRHQEQLRPIFQLLADEATSSLAILSGWAAAAYPVQRPVQVCVCTPSCLMHVPVSHLSVAARSECVPAAVTALGLVAA
jgi:hypothetical protein